MSPALTPSYRLRVEYAKQGRGAFLSHLEVIRALERTVRRARLPFASTHGFSPHMRISFGPALGVGTASRSEYFDVVLVDYVDPQAAQAALRGAASAVLPIVNVGYVGAQERSLSAAITILKYQVMIEKELDVPTEIAPTLAVEQKGRIKTYDTVQVLPEGISAVTGDRCTIIRFTIRATPEGTLRPDSLLAYLLGDTVESHVVIERTATLIQDEAGNWVEPLR